MFLYMVLLFILFVPGQVFTVPFGKSRSMTVLVHAVAFAFVWHLTHKIVWNFSEQANYML